LTTSPRPRPRRATGVLVAALLALTACTTPAPAPENPVDQRSVVLARSSLEDALSRYQEMQHRIQTELDAALGPHQWAQFDAGLEDGCGFAFPDVRDGQTRFMPQLGFNGSIPDQQWPTAEKIVTAVIADYGFNTAGLLRIDKPGHHELNAHDPVLGADFNFGTQLNTSLQTTTGCHLPAAKRPGSGA
jgi:Lipoprotein confined to pathogenic Mycobacterium